MMRKFFKHIRLSSFLREFVYLWSFQLNVTARRTIVEYKERYIKQRELSLINTVFTAFQLSINSGRYDFFNEHDFTCVSLKCWFVYIKKGVRSSQICVYETDVQFSLNASNLVNFTPLLKKWETRIERVSLSKWCLLGAWPSG